MLMRAWLDRNPTLSNREFRSLCLDAVCYANGTGGEQVVFGLLVLQVSGSSWWVGVAFALYFAPLLFVGAPAGAIADWLPRRRLLQVVQAMIGINLLAVGLLVLAGWAELWHLLLMTFVSGCVRSLYQPARLSFAVDLVGAGRAASGLAMLQIGNRIGQGIGALLAGMVMQQLGAEYAYMSLAIGHFIGFFVLGRLKTEGGVASAERTSLAQTFRDFGAEMASNRTLVVLVVATAAVNIFGFAFMAVLPELVSGRLGLGAQALGLLTASRAVGGAVAMLLFSFWGSQRRLGTVYALVVASFGAGLVLLGAANSFTTAVGALLLVAGAASLTDVLSQTMMQLSVSDRLRGRAMGAWMISVGLSPIGTLEIGALAASIGDHLALMINGVIVVGCALLFAWFAPRLNRL